MKKNNKPLIVGVLSIAFLFTALLILYIRASTPYIDINSASKEALISLPDIGPVLAERIIDGRPYKDIYELDRVKGVGPGTIEVIKDKITAKEF